MDAAVGKHASYWLICAELVELEDDRIRITDKERELLARSRPAAGL